MSHRYITLMKTKIISRILQVFALYLFFSTSYTILGRILTIQSGKKINGEVVSSYKEKQYSTQTSGKSYGTTHYILRPIIQYKVNGETFEINGKILGEVGKEYQIGTPVELIYNPNQPSYSFINSFLELWYEPLKYIIYSVILFFFGTFLRQIMERIKEKIIHFFRTHFFL